MKAMVPGNDFREALCNQPVDEAAILILGCELVTAGCRVRLVEVEAYGGSYDPGSHAYRGKTPRNQIMFGEPGYLYMYFTYGNHWMANVVVGPPGNASAILLRAAEPLEGVSSMWTRRPKAVKETDLLSGPGKLCAALGLSGTEYGVDLLASDSPVRLELGARPGRVLVSTRIGLSPGHGEETPWRFIDAERIQWASRPHPKNA